jgi:hypothetical protein
MTVSLDARNLNVTKWGERVQTVATQYDAWISNAYKRNVRVFGIIRQYIIECVEKDVSWTNSLVNYFEQVAQNGNTVTFYSDETTRPVNNVSVYVLNVSWEMENLGGQNIRKFTLTLQEA